MRLDIKSEAGMQEFGSGLGGLLGGGDVVELIGDVGAGKTTLAKSIAAGLGVDEDVQSPSFTISRVYQTSGGLQLAHYDFYRLKEPGIMSHELHESVSDKHAITLVEWADIVDGVLPQQRLSIQISTVDEDSRRLVISGQGARYENLIGRLA